MTYNLTNFSVRKLTTKTPAVRYAVCCRKRWSHTLSNSFCFKKRTYDNNRIFIMENKLYFVHLAKNLNIYWFVMFQIASYVSASR